MSLGESLNSAASHQVGFHLQRLRLGV